MARSENWLAIVFAWHASLKVLESSLWAVPAQRSILRGILSYRTVSAKPALLDTVMCIDIVIHYVTLPVSSLSQLRRAHLPTTGRSGAAACRGGATSARRLSPLGARSCARIAGQSHDRFQGLFDSAARRCAREPLPGFSATLERAHPGDALRLQEQRRTGAGGFVGSTTK